MCPPYRPCVFTNYPSRLPTRQALPRSQQRRGEAGCGAAWARAHVRYSSLLQQGRSRRYQMRPRLGTKEKATKPKHISNGTRASGQPISKETRSWSRRSKMALERAGVSRKPLSKKGYRPSMVSFQQRVSVIELHSFAPSRPFGLGKGFNASRERLGGRKTKDPHKAVPGSLSFMLHPRFLKRF